MRSSNPRLAYSLMATSSIANLFSFFTNTEPPPSASATQPKTLPSNLSVTTPSPSSSTHSGWTPLVLTNEAHPSPSHSTESDVMSVVCPSFAFANTLYFRSAYNVQVNVDDNEPEEKLLGRFRREVMRAGVIQECKCRRFFENNQDEKKRKSREAAKRNRRRRPPQARYGPQDKQESSKGGKGDEVEDNWEHPFEVLPY